jgi:hypothetical protein
MQCRAIDIREIGMASWSSSAKSVPARMIASTASRFRRIWAKAVRFLCCSSEPFSPPSQLDIGIANVVHSFWPCLDDLHVTG